MEREQEENKMMYLYRFYFLIVNCEYNIIISKVIDF